MSDEQTLVVVVTGLSGAGKSTAINALEDAGYFCVDNLPTPVVAPTLEACSRGGLRRLAFGIDVRVGSFLDDVVNVLDAVPADGHHELRVLFLDASDEALLRRFSSTRRPHPLTSLPFGGRVAHAVLDGVAIERVRLAPLRARASLVIDTTLLSVHELRRVVLDRFGLTAAGLRMHIRFISFGFKYGTPVDADTVLDVRFLANPYFVEGLRDLPGTNELVRDYVLAQVDTREYIERAARLLSFTIPRFEQEGKAYLTVAVGCTGGRHRSVVMVEALREALMGTAPEIEIVHRDIGRREETPRASVPPAEVSR